MQGYAIENNGISIGNIELAMDYIANMQNYEPELTNVKAELFNKETEQNVKSDDEEKDYSYVLEKFSLIKGEKVDIEKLRSLVGISNIENETDSDDETGDEDELEDELTSEEKALMIRQMLMGGSAVNSEDNTNESEDDTNESEEDLNEHEDATNDYEDEAEFMLFGAGEEEDEADEDNDDIEDNEEQPELFSEEADEEESDIEEADEEADEDNGFILFGEDDTDEDSEEDNENDIGADEADDNNNEVEVKANKVREDAEDISDEAESADSILESLFWEDSGSDDSTLNCEENSSEYITEEEDKHGDSYISGNGSNNSSSSDENENEEELEYNRRRMEIERERAMERERYMRSKYSRHDEEMSMSREERRRRDRERRHKMYLERDTYKKKDDNSLNRAETSKSESLSSSVSRESNINVENTWSSNSVKNVKTNDIWGNGDTHVEDINKAVRRVEETKPVNNIREEQKSSSSNYNEMDIKALGNVVKEYMIKSGAKSHLISIDVLEEQFGRQNINRLVLKGILIKTSKGVTMGI